MPVAVVTVRQTRGVGFPVAERDDLDRYFNEEGCGLLILQTHNYLVRLAAAIRAALNEGA